LNITDTHLHLWDLSRVEYDWLAAAKDSILCRTHGPEEIQSQLKQAGVNRAVLVQSANSIEDSGYMFEMSRSYDWIAGVVAWLPLTDPVWSHRLLETYQDEPFFKGIRHLMHIEPDNRWLLDLKVQESLQILADQGIPLDVVTINNHQFDAVLETAARIPSLRIIIDHLSQPPQFATPEYTEWSAQMGDAASLPHIWLKVSGLGTIPRNAEQSLEDRFLPILSGLIDQFGFDRLLCGGDWPISRLDRPYADTWASIRSLFEKLTNDASDLQNIFNLNATRCYGL
jgi:L-fuconolactonase